jgi:hypothetical protein
MFAGAYFAARYFAPRYFPQAGSAVVLVHGPLCVVAGQCYVFGAVAGQAYIPGMVEGQVMCGNG